MCAGEVRGSLGFERNFSRVGVVAWCVRVSSVDIGGTDTLERDDPMWSDQVRRVLAAQQRAQGISFCCWEGYLMLFVGIALASLKFQCC